MSEKGKIVEIKDNLAIINIVRNEACGHCKACEKGNDNNTMVMKAKNQCEGKVGDTVLVELEVEKLIFATFILYGVPLITMVLGFLLGTLLFSNELFSFFTGILFLFITYMVIKFSEKFWKTENYIPVAKSIVNN